MAMIEHKCMLLKTDLRCAQIFSELRLKETWAYSQAGMAFSKIDWP